MGVAYSIAAERKAKKAIKTQDSIMTQGLTRADLEAAISKYGPTLRLHPDERYCNCSVEWFLSHSTLVDSQNPANNMVHPLETDLPHGPKQGSRYYLQIEDAVKPGNFETAKAYVNALWLKGTTYTDLQFWLFSGYNGPGTVRFDSLVGNKIDHVGDIDVAPLGEHVGDWEYAGIRIDNSSKELIGIMLSEHGKNIFVDKVAMGKKFTFVDGTHPVVYSSLNGHANFAAPGDNFTEHKQILGWPAGLRFDVVNATKDGGRVLVTAERHEIVAAEWLKETKDEVATPAWVGYPYRWGPEGTSTSMDPKTLGKFLEAALGDREAMPLLHDPLVLAASELLHIFVKSDINGPAAPASQGPWVGEY